MYGASTELLDLFEDRDVLVIVDDWWDANQADPNARICLMGRAFLRSDFEAVDDLLGVLRREQAGCWHGTGGPNLFKSDAFDELMRTLERARGRIYTMNRNRAAFSAPRLEQQWKELLERHGPPWTDVLEAKATYAFLTRLGYRLDDEIPRGLRIRIVTDRMAWMRGAAGSAPIEALLTTNGPRADVWALRDKEAPGASKYLPLLGLVDSELWAWGRFQSRRLPSGELVRDALRLRSAQGWPAEPILTAAELDHIFGDAVKDPTAARRLVEYWHRLVSWIPDGRGVELPEL
jgi:hypothetical protein